MILDALEPFTYQDVHLDGGPMASQAKYARNYYLALNEDSLLQGFRQRAGLPAPGNPMGGWYDPEGFAAAHPFGQYISALCRMYANTGDARFKAKAQRLVHGYHLAMGPDGYFFASKKVAKEWPCYIYDKMCIAMRDAYNLTGDAEALVALKRMTDWAYPNLPRRSDEWYTLPENLYKCFELTRDPRYLEMAKEYDYSKEYYDVFARGENAFTPDRHAYSHVNSLSSAAKAYEFTRDPKYFDALTNAWRFLTGTQMYASGGWGADERFVVSGQGKLAESLKSSEKSFETPCGAYANVNLDRYLLRFTGAPKYGDNMERVLLNGMLAALPPEPDGRSFYYSNYRAGAKKEFFGDVWPCCNGTYAEITADYPLDVFFHSGDRLFVNLFADSSVKWRLGGHAVSVRQSTSYPLNSSTALTVKTAAPARFTLEVRNPGWSAFPAEVRVNGRPVSIPTGPGKRLAITRTWHDGDRLNVAYKPSLRFEPIDGQNPTTCALMNGPLLLVALANGEVELHGDGSDPSAWIKPVDGSPDEFATASGVRFRPLYRVESERYTTYIHLR